MQGKRTFFLCSKGTIVDYSICHRCIYIYIYTILCVHLMSWTIWRVYNSNSLGTDRARACEYVVHMAVSLWQTATDGRATTYGAQRRSVRVLLMKGVHLVCTGSTLTAVVRLVTVWYGGGGFARTRTRLHRGGHNAIMYLYTYESSRPDRSVEKYRAKTKTTVEVRDVIELDRHRKPC